MNAQPTVRRTEKKLLDCYSYKGEDFCCCGDRRYVKRFTSHARRRYNRALARNVEN